MDPADREEIVGILHGLRIRFGDRLTEEESDFVASLIDANELGLALEQLADVLSEDCRPVAPGERADMLSLAGRMGMGDRVPEALSECPDD